MMIDAQMRFKIKPVFIMSRMASFSLPKTMVFGGVATGSMNAQEAQNVTGSRK